MANYFNNNTSATRIAEENEIWSSAITIVSDTFLSYTSHTDTYHCIDGYMQMEGDQLPSIWESKMRNYKYEYLKKNGVFIDVEKVINGMAEMTANDYPNFYFGIYCKDNNQDNHLLLWRLNDPNINLSFDTRFTQKGHENKNMQKDLKFVCRFDDCKDFNLTQLKHNHKELKKAAQQLNDR